MPGGISEASFYQENEFHSLYTFKTAKPDMLSLAFESLLYAQKQSSRCGGKYSTYKDSINIRIIFIQECNQFFKSELLSEKKKFVNFK